MGLEPTTLPLAAGRATTRQHQLLEYYQLYFYLFFQSRASRGLYSLNLFNLANLLTTFACGVQFGARELNFGQYIFDLGWHRTHDPLVPSQPSYHSATGAVVSSPILM